MGRKPYRVGKKRDRYLQVKLRPDERQRLEALARAQGQTLSAYVRAQVLREEAPS